MCVHECDVMCVRVCRYCDVIVLFYEYVCMFVCVDMNGCANTHAHPRT